MIDPQFELSAVYVNHLCEEFLAAASEMEDGNFKPTRSFVQKLRDAALALEALWEER